MAITTDMTYAGGSPADWARHIATTTRREMRKVSKEMLRKYVITAMVERQGGIETGLSGRNFSWPVQWRLHDEAANTGLQARNFAPTDQFKQANLEWGGLEITDSIREREFLENRGKEAIIKVASTMHDRMKESMTQKFALTIYDDGATTSKKLYGLESMMGVDAGGTSSGNRAYDWGTAGATPSMTKEDVAEGDPVMVHSDTYAGLLTDFGNYGGAQTYGAFPEGKCDEEADFWSPLIVNANSDFFGTTSANGWEDNGPDILRFMIAHMSRNSVDQQLDLFVMDRTMLVQLKNALLGSGAGRPEVGLVSSENGLKSFGFKNVFEFDGVECTTEYGVPTTNTYRASATAVVVRSLYGLTTKAISIHSAYDELFSLDPKSGEYDIDTQAYKYCLRMLGQFKFGSPRRFCKAAGYSA